VSYAYDYSVADDHSGVQFTKQEDRQDYNTQGSYRVALPDGRVQTVSYTADEDGFQAQVAYEGEAQYPPEKYDVIEAPSYAAPKQQGYAAPKQEGYAAPKQEGYAAPKQQESADYSR